MVGATSSQQFRGRLPALKTVLDRLNGSWHRRALLIFLAIVVAHWAEHLIQAFQIWVLDWPRPRARGLLGLQFPWLVKSEWLHYWYAIVMLVGLVLLRPSYRGRGRAWWNAALAIQMWHHFEHFLLLLQVAVLHQNLFGSKVPTSIVQLVAPRVELHLFYNVIVFIPMVIAMYYHRYPPAVEGRTAPCTCARPPAATTQPA